MIKNEIFNVGLIICCAVILTLVSHRVLDFIYLEQKSAFIDEIFHVPQAQLYCRNQWMQWNPKITTLPGLYIVSYVLLKPFEKLGNNDFCSIYTLRLTNLLATGLNFFLAFKISCLLERKYKVKSNLLLKVLTALNIAVFPPLYFFTFLYYTDVWSTTFVLLMYCMHLLDGKLSRVLGAFAGFMAVLMRQTNIIWVGLMLIDDIWTLLSKNVKAVSVQDYKFSKKVFHKFISEYLSVQNIFRKLNRLITNLLLRNFHYVIICLMFIIFITINKSVVLGDKKAHAVTFHPMQNLYFLDFTLFFGWPFLIFEVLSLWRKPYSIFLAFILTGCCAALSEINKLEHPYLLADNRHLAFYLWKRVFGHPILRRAVIPTYVGAGVLLWRLLQKRCHFMFMVMLAMCIILNLTPQYLFELRYYIIPFVMCRLQFKQSPAVYFETLFFLLVNAGVIYLFLNRPFVWSSEPNATQRFICLNSSLSTATQRTWQKFIEAESREEMDGREEERS